MKNVTCEHCGSEKEVRFYKKERMLCGKHREQMRKFGLIRKRTLSDKNDYVDRGNFYEIIIYSRNLKEKGRAFIDKQDKEKVDSVSWCIDGQGYVMSSKGKIHQIILGKKDGLEIDHINRNKLDNRRQNLRHISHSVNAHNSGRIGISYHKLNKKWQAYIGVNKNQIHLGYFRTKKEALYARKKAVNLYYGE